jgi:hypothetical protein
MMVVSYEKFIISYETVIFSYERTVDSYDAVNFSYEPRRGSYEKTSFSYEIASGSYELRSISHRNSIYSPEEILATKGTTGRKDLVVKQTGYVGYVLAA